MNCPECKHTMLCVQYILTSEDYDGTSEYRCEPCQIRVGRWTNQRLADGELEPRYGRRRESREAPHTQDK